MLLIAKPSESGRLPNRRIWPLDPAPPEPPIWTSRRTLSKSFRRCKIFIFTCSSFRFRIYFFRCSDVRLHFSILVSGGSVRFFIPHRRRRMRRLQSYLGSSLFVWSSRWNAATRVGGLTLCDILGGRLPPVSVDLCARGWRCPEVRLVCSFVRLSVCPSVRLSVCLSLCKTPTRTPLGHLC